MGIAKEGYPFISVAGGAAAATYALGFTAAAWAALMASLFFVFFFRDPKRQTPPGDAIVAAPADGRVIEVQRGVKNAKLGSEEYQKVSIFMSPLDVHVNRAPISGMVASVEHRPGQFRAAFRGKSSELNEHTAVVLEPGVGAPVMFVQIAGWLARRIVCNLRVGQRVERGQRVGMIMFGSRVDLYLPSQVRLEVAVGSRVKAGESVVGEYR